MWEFWFLILIFLLLLTIWTNHLLMISLDASALITLFVSLLPLSITCQILLFFVFFSLITLILYILFPNCYLLLSPTCKPLHHLIGLNGIVSKSIGSGILNSGHIKLDGETWCALSYNNKPIPAGIEVAVTAIKGVHLIVSPTETHKC